MYCKKKILAIAVLSAVCINTNALALSNDSNNVTTEKNYIKSFAFEAPDASHISFEDLIEIGKAKMREMGFEQDWISDLPEKEIASFADVESATVSTQYLRFPRQSNTNSISSTSDVEILTKEEFEQAVAEQRQQEMEAYEQWKSGSQPFKDDIFFDGLMKFTTTCARTDPKSDYKVSARYEWVGSCNPELTDVFGICPAPDTYPDTETPYAVNKYTERIESRVTGKVTVNNHKQEFTSHNQFDYKPGAESTNGYGIKVPLPKIQISASTRKFYSNICGYISYNMHFTQNIRRDFQIYGTYAHQTNRLGPVSISASFPPGGISLAPSILYSFKTNSLPVHETYTPY